MRKESEAKVAHALKSRDGQAMSGRSASVYYLLSVGSIQELRYQQKLWKNL
jgi:hypothetical protein